MLDENAPTTWAASIWLAEGNAQRPEFPGRFFGTVVSTLSLCTVSAESTEHRVDFIFNNVRIPKPQR